MTARNWKQKRQEHAESGALEKAKDGTALEPIPVGTWLDLTIKRADEKDTRSDGIRILIKYQVEAPEEFKGRIVFSGHNVICPGSEDTERIALENLTRISLAAGLDDCVDDLPDLLGRTCRAHVYEHDEWGGRVSEQIRDWTESEIEGEPLQYADEEIPF